MKENSSAPSPVCKSYWDQITVPYATNAGTATYLKSGTDYGISASTGISGIYANTGNLTATFTDISLKSLTDCAATGFHIISAQGGSTQNWTSESASFNYNDSDGYSYKIWKVR